MLEGLGKTPPDPKVKALQEKLRAAGYNIVVDGIMGPKTRDALAKYNAAHRGIDPGKQKGKPGAHGPGLTTAGPTAQTPATSPALPKPGSKWSDFWQGLIVAGAGYAQKKDAERQAAKMRASGQDANVIQAADGTYTVTTSGGAGSGILSENKGPILIGGGLLLLLLLMRKK